MNTVEQNHFTETESNLKVFAPDMTREEVLRILRIELAPINHFIRYTRSSGAGGQHVNKTESAVQLLIEREYLSQLFPEAVQPFVYQTNPTKNEIEFQNQDQRSQGQNKEKVIDAFVDFIKIPFKRAEEAQKKTFFEDKNRFKKPAQSIKGRAVKEKIDRQTGKARRKVRERAEIKKRRRETFDRDDY